MAAHDGYDHSESTDKEGSGKEGATSSSGKSNSVVFVSQQYPPDRSGHASRIRELASNLADGDWDVTVLAPPPSFPPGEFDRSWNRTDTTVVDGVKIIRLWAWQPTSQDPTFLSRMAFYVLFAVHAMVWLLFEGRSRDIVVTTSPPISTGLAGFPAVALDQHWVVDVRDQWIDASVALGFIREGGLLERASRRYQRRVLYSADSITVTTPTLGDALCETYGESLTDKIELIPNGVDIDRFAVPERNRNGNGQNVARSDDVPSQRIPDNDPNYSAADGGDGAGDSEQRVIIYTGNIGHAQDLETCIQALANLPEDVVLRLVGGGDAVPDLKRTAKKHGVQERVEFLGSVPHDRIPALLREADVGLAPLKDDPELAYAMPTKVYEYLGSELPVLATGRGELARFVEDSGGGALAANDAASITKELENLLSQPERRARAGRRGFEYVDPRYERAEIAARFERHLQEAASGRVVA